MDMPANVRFCIELDQPCPRPCRHCQRCCCAMRTQAKQCVYCSKEAELAGSRGRHARALKRKRRRAIETQSPMEEHVDTKRRICWPTPDKACMAGDCIYCEDKRYRLHTYIKKYAEQHGMTEEFQRSLGSGRWVAAVHTVEYQGKAITLRELSKLTGMSYSRLYERIVRGGMAAEEAVSRPIKRQSYWGQ